MGRPLDHCAPGDRRCSLKRESKMPPCVWVGPKDGGWVKIVDLEEVDPSAARACSPVDSASDHGNSIIFAAIAAFRDELCATTLHGMFDRATNPSRVRVAVIQQNGAGDVDCLERYCELASKNGTVPGCPYKDQVAMKRFDASEAKGPTWARAQDTDMLPDDAEFCLRTDSHMAFASGWDELQIEQWYAAKNEFAVLSTYVADASQIKKDGSMMNINGLWEVPHLCSIQWENGHVRNMQAKAARNLEHPKLTTLWAAGLSFSRCHAERTVPYDPHTPYVFWGEEFSRTARYFTHGYDVYTPPRTLIAHDYKRTQGDPTHYKWNGRGGPRLDRNETIIKMRDAANRRIWTLLGMPGGDPPSARAGLGAYGLGDKRTLDQLMDFTGIRLTNKTVFANRCGNIDWVPWRCDARFAELDMAQRHAKEEAAASPLATPINSPHIFDHTNDAEASSSSARLTTATPPPPPPIRLLRRSSNNKAAAAQDAAAASFLSPRSPHRRLPQQPQSYALGGAAIATAALVCCFLARSILPEARRNHKKTRGARVSKVV